MELLQGTLDLLIRTLLPDPMHGHAIAKHIQRTSLERKGVSRSVAMKLTGHKTEAVYRRYVIVSSEDLREGVRRLESTDRYTSSYTQPGRKAASKPTAQKS